MIENKLTLTDDEGDSLSVVHDTGDTYISFDTDPDGGGQPVYLHADELSALQAFICERMPQIRKAANPHG